MSLFTIMLSNADQCGQQFSQTIVGLSDFQDLNCVWQWMNYTWWKEEWCLELPRVIL